MLETKLQATTILPFESEKTRVETQWNSKKHGLFMSPQPKQLFAKLKQEANLERTKARGAVQAKKSIR